MPTPGHVEPESRLACDLCKTLAILVDAVSFGLGVPFTKAPRPLDDRGGAGSVGSPTSAAFARATSAHFHGAWTCVWCTKNVLPALAGEMKP